MQINALRKELISLISLPVDRPPAIRRSARENWLYATDLPGICSEAELETVLEKLADAGWEHVQETGWLLLRKTAAEPPEGWYSGAFGPEAACCLSLIERHQNRKSNAEPAQRMLIKAGEKGYKAYETACAILHRDWASRLRTKDPLPAVNRRYFGA